MDEQQLKKMDEQQLQNVRVLKDFAERLKALSFPTSPFTAEQAKLVWSALDSYLSGNTKSLDAAFGLTPKKGAKGYGREFNRKRAVIIYAQRKLGKSWMKIEDELGGKQGIPKDRSDIIDVLKPFEIELMTDEITLNDLIGDDDI